MITGSTTKEETKEIYNRLTTFDPKHGGNEREIKLCYVTVFQFVLSTKSY